MGFRLFIARLASVSLGLVLATAAVATEERQLVESINAYRSAARVKRLPSCHR